MKIENKYVLPGVLWIVAILLAIFRSDVASYFNIVTAIAIMLISSFNLFVVFHKGNKKYRKLATLIFLPALVVSLSTLDLVSSFGHAEKNIEIGILLILSGILLEVKNTALNKETKFSVLGMANLLFIIAGLFIVLISISYEEVILIIAIILGVFSLIKIIYNLFSK